MKLQSNQHNWCIIAQEHNPYKEYAFCDRCNKYKDDNSNIYTRTQFKRIAKLQRLFQPDSTERLTFDSLV